MLLHPMHLCSQVLSANTVKILSVSLIWTIGQNHRGHNMYVSDMYAHTHRCTLLVVKADQVIWLLLGWEGDVIVIGGRAGVMTLNQPTAGCCWLVVYSHCHLSFRKRNYFTFFFTLFPMLSCYFGYMPFKLMFKSLTSPPFCESEN